jgi:hypothetical protein
VHHGIRALESSGRRGLALRVAPLVQLDGVALGAAKTRAGPLGVTSQSDDIIATPQQCGCERATDQAGGASDGNPQDGLQLSTLT